MKQQIFILFYLLGIVLVTTSCATVFGGSKNKLVVNDGYPPEADVYLDGQKIGTTPVDMKISKYLLQEGSLVEIKKEGYQTDSVIIERKVHTLYTLADAISTIGIGLAIDLATGNVYRPANNKIEYKLIEE